LLYLDNGKDNEAAALVNQVRKTATLDRKLIATLVQALDMLGKGERMTICCILTVRIGKYCSLRGNVEEESQG
jgi:hypothetical protein